jgi:hypothetical protein
MDDAFIKSTEEVLDFFQVDIDKGLTQNQVEDSTRRFGKNGMFFFITYCRIYQFET